MKNRITILWLAALVGGLDPAVGDAYRERWQETFAEVRERLSDGSLPTDEAADRLLSALALAEGSLSPLDVARTLDEVASLLHDPEEAMRLLERSYSLKEAVAGPRSAEVADTLMLIAETEDDLLRLEMHDASDSAFLEARIKKSGATRREALSIRQEVFGEGSCEAGEVQALIALDFEVSGRLDRAERLLREILVYCPPPTDENGKLDDSGDSVGFGAFASLADMLRSQGREAELEELEKQFDRY